MIRPLICSLLACGLASAQTNKAAVDYFYPSGSDVPTNTKILAHITCCGTVNSVSLTSGGNVPGQFAYASAPDGTWLVFTPAQTLQVRTGHTLTIRIDGQPLTFSFNTGGSADTTGPTVVRSRPSAGGDLGAASFSMSFSKPMNPLISASPTFTDMSTGNNWSIPWNLSDPFTFTTQQDFPLGTVVRARFGSQLPEDLSGNKLAAPPDFVFTTYSAAPKDGPQLLGTLPVEAETGVPTNAAVFLQFDRPLTLPDASVFALGSSGDPQVALKVEKTSNGKALILRPQTLLRGNQDYTLRADSFYDAWGGKLAAGVVLHFRTGTLPESRAFGITQSPASILPRVSTLRWTFSRPLNPYLLPHLAQVKLSPTTYSLPLTDVRLLPDGVTIEADVPASGTYLLAGPEYDRVESKAINNFGASSIQVQSISDTQPPSLLAVFPTPGIAVPATATVSALFDEAIDASLTGRITLWRGDTAVAADASVFGAQLTLRPRGSLADGQYRVEIRDPRDVAGNTADTVSWTFSVPAAAPADRFALLSSDPADGAQNVDPASALAFTFNSPVNAFVLLASSYPSPVMVNSAAVAGKWRFDGNQALFTPDGGLPPGMRISWNLSATDFAGNRATGTAGGFWTARADAGGSFAVTAVSPPTGETADAGSSAITVDLSQPALAGTVNTDNILLIGPGQSSPISVSYDAQFRRIRITTFILLNGTYRLVLGPGVLNQTGAPLEPFTADVSLRPQTLSYSIQVNSTPGPFLNTREATLSAGSPLSIYFVQPVNRDLVERGLVVYAAGSEVPGRIAWTPDSTALRFTPATPFGSRVSGIVVLSLAPWGGTGVELMRFSTGYPPDPVTATWSVLPSLSYTPNDTVLDVEFNSDRPPDYIVAANLGYYDLGTTETLVPLTFEVLSARRFRFRPTKPLVTGKFYHIALKTKGSDASSPYFQLSPSATPLSKRIFVGPAEEMGPAPVNVQIWMETGTPVNAITVKPTLTSNGLAVPFTLEIADNGFLVLLHPLSILDGNAAYVVSFQGLEDMAGRPLPERTWTFHTGAGPDLFGATAISASPKGLAPGSSVLRVTFDKPVYLAGRHKENSPLIASDFASIIAGSSITGAIDRTADGRTLAVIPDHAWPPGTAVSAPVSYAGWNGPNYYVASSGTPGFTAAPLATLPRPVVDAVNPYRDAPDAPLNVLIQFRFADVIDATAVRARLEADGEPVASSIVAAADGRTFTLSTGSLLQAGRNYTVTVDGARAGDGTGQDPPETWSFRTANVLSTLSSRARGALMPGDLPAFRVTAPQPFNAVSISPATAIFQVLGQPVAATAAIATDPALLVVQSVIAPDRSVRCGWYLSGVTDWAGNAITGQDTLNPCAPPAATAPPVLSLNPPDGGVLPWNDDVAVVADRAVLLRYGAAGVQVMHNGVAVPSTVDLSNLGTLLKIRLMIGWLPGETYTISVRGILDLAGNEVPPFAWTYSIAPDSAADATFLKFVSSNPAQGAVGVPSNTVISMDFNRTVLPDPTLLSSLFASSNNASYNLSGLLAPAYQGSHLQLTSGGLPAGMNVGANVYVTDQIGGRLSRSVNFTTAASPDATPPSLDSITPAPGSTIAPSRTALVLRFSEPVLISGTVARFSIGGQAVSPAEILIPLQGDGRTLQLTFDLPASKTGTLDLFGAITDMAGNPLAPVSLVYSTGSADLSYLSVLSTKPTDYTSQVLTDAVVEVRFNQPVPEAGLRPALTMTTNGVLTPVNLTPTGDGSIWQITPLSPWPAGAVVTLQISTLAYAANGALLSQPLFIRFGTAGISAPTLAAVESTATAIDVRFAGPLDRVPEEPFGIRLLQQKLSARVERVTPDWFRIVPDTPLDPTQAYFLMVGPGIEVPLHLLPPDESPEEVESASVDDTGSIRIRLKRPLRMTAFQLLDPDGQPIECDAHLTADRTTLILSPHHWKAPNTRSRQLQIYFHRPNPLRTIDIRN